MTTLLLLLPELGQAAFGTTIDQSVRHLWDSTDSSIDQVIEGGMIMSGSRSRTIDEYIAKFPRNARDILEELRRVIRESAPETEEAMSYGMPAFRLDGKSLVYFGAWKNHIGFYPNPSAIEAFKKDLSRYKRSKGAIQFPLDEPIPFDVVRKIVRFRVRDIKLERKQS